MVAYLPQFLVQLLIIQVLISLQFVQYLLLTPLPFLHLVGLALQLLCFLNHLLDLLNLTVG